MVRKTCVLAAVILAAAACGGSPTPAAVQTPSPLEGTLTQGLIAYVAGNAVGVLDPASGKSITVAPLPAGSAFRISGPVWAPAPGLSYPVIYFTVHDDRPAENRSSSGVVPYDWLFRVDPFAGVISPVAASYDFQSEGPIGVVANDHYLSFTVGCCTSYEVDALDLTKSSAPVNVMAKPPTQAAMFVEGAAPGTSGLFAVRAFGTGLWYWLNMDARVLHKFPLQLGPDDGPIAITADGTTVAVSRPDKGPVIEPIDVTVPVISVGPPATGSPTTTPAKTTPTPRPAQPRAVNSKLPHADAMAWSPDATLLALAVSGGIQIYNASGKDGTPPLKSYLARTGVSGIDWSGPIRGQNYVSVKTAAGPQAAVDALLKATKLPAAADTLSNRPQTKVYVWQYDSSKASPIATISDATPSVLQQYPPLAANVVFHHWAPSASWALLGGCFRYRVVIKGSIATIATTIGLGGAVPCKAP